ncbi:MAG: hypothetical protein EOO65_02290 [Methanosarcinales archaeon]|nr:MAG: hypothetical protein EOO65_02290 [Methanosarcinales archaeon]
MQEMFERIFYMKFLPPGRGLWAMGTPITETRHLYAALNNCAFVSTADVAHDPVAPFTFLMDAAMLGVGVGFDTDGAQRVVVGGAASPDGSRLMVDDSREGWVASVQVLLEAFFYRRPLPQFDYSAIRPRGALIKVCLQSAVHTALTLVGAS